MNTIRDISVIIPVYNEKESLAELTKQLSSVFKAHALTYELLFVDDGSTDGSLEEAIALHKKYPTNVKVIQLRKNAGKSAALAAGFDHTNGEIVVTIDADLQDDPEEIPTLLAKIHEGYDLAVGWRTVRKDAGKKVFGSRIFNAIVARTSGIPLHDFNNGLKVMKKKVADEIDLYGELHRYIPLLADARGFTVTEAPVHHRPRQYGVSKFGTKRILNASFDLLTTLFLIQFKERPLQLFGPTGALMSVIGLIILTYLSILHFMGESIGRRPLLLFGVLLFLFGVQLISTGLLGELITGYHSKERRYFIERIVS